MALDTLLSIDRSADHSRVTDLTLSLFLPPMCLPPCIHWCHLPFYLLIHLKIREGIDMLTETLKGCYLWVSRGEQGICPFILVSEDHQRDLFA